MRSLVSPAALLLLRANALLFSSCGGILKSLMQVQAVDPVQVNYTDPIDGTTLVGYLAVPPSSTPPKGYAVFLPDWDGVSDYEMTRAAMVAEEWGYVGLAADVFGNGYQPQEIPERIQMMGPYRNNITLGNSRIRSAVEYVKGMDGYDESMGVAILGYCFGGSLVLNHALSGADDAAATVAYHGAIGSVNKSFNDTNITSPIAIYSGGKDTSDSTASVMEMEDALNVQNGEWEISRYSDVMHGFTNFLSPSAYNEHVDDRTWESTHRFLKEVFGEIEHVADIPPEEEVMGEEVNYTDPKDGAALTGFVSVPAADAGEKVPAVVIVHDASGIDLYEQTRAQMLADMGYVGFAADMFGSDHGYDLTNRTQRFELLGGIRGNSTFFVQRMKAGVEAAKSHPRVDPNKIGMIGYCFGGTGVITYAVSGEADVRAVVSFHGGLSRGYGTVTGKIHAKMNIQSGGDDDASSSIEELENAMESGNATWEYARYSDVLHGFTNFFDTRGRYNARADVRSWESMKGFFAEAFADDAMMPTAADVAPTPAAAAPTAAEAMPTAASPTSVAEPTPEVGERSSAVSPAGVIVAVAITALSVASLLF